MIFSRTKQWNIFTDDLQWLTFQSFLGRTTPNMPATFWLGFTKVINPEPLTTGPLQKYISLSVILTNIVVGLFYRILLYKNVWKTGVLSRPINLLTGMFESWFPWTENRNTYLHNLHWRTIGPLTVRCLWPWQCYLAGCLKLKEACPANISQQSAPLVHACTVSVL